MNKIIVLTVITILSGTLQQCQASDTVDEIVDEIGCLISTVESVESDLKSFYANYSANYTSNVMNSRDTEFKNINITAKIVYDITRNDIAAAKKEGKDADHCFGSMEREVGNATRTACDKIDECLDGVFVHWKKINSNLNEFFTSRKPSFGLTDILIDCVSLYQTETEKCVVLKMIVFRASVNRYKEFAEQLKRRMESPEGPGIIPPHCFETPMRNFESNILAAKKAADECIQNS